MNKRPILLIALLALAFLATMNNPAQARPEGVVLSGLAKFKYDTSPGKCIAPDHLRICWDRGSIIQFEMDDARLTGDASLAFDSIYTKAPYAGRIKGEFRLDNHGGSWVGIWKGSIDAQSHTLFTAEGQGEGSYEGLAIRLRMERSNSNWWAPMMVYGTIKPGSSRAHGR